MLSNISDHFAHCRRKISSFFIAFHEDIDYEMVNNALNSDENSVVYNAIIAIEGILKRMYVKECDMPPDDE